ncbi:hypothetical protein [Kitasatospora sp. NPDC057223]|uniref:hypothetical protein n=1 Tax=Kitasatospora sp. NPDC057223 TaxID=3346055 RepID=UPI0036441D10
MYRSWSRIDRTQTPAAYAHTVLVRPSSPTVGGAALRTDAVLGSVDCGRDTPPTCQVLPNGTALRSERVPLANGQLMWVVIAIRPDGRRVRVSATNSEHPITDSSHPTRAEPPLTIDQLQAIALSPHWDRQTR